ncbi:hypothetical protein COX97_01865 [Candidatus Pacearchaeota archaeon CG_4_10_14_0_2_um_filter_05_32_18]|nr:MAG: hypothetical protein AUJ62_00165 [Candidatus Pacearchaeota archaeon CG1_02_32_21]PIZ83027.1 MAG: hypothetical protein COX97_01865 [Candidatus Pacearchaeota archaeon CG_4_10_14_0_2_um_filter_05_32_18]
MGKKIQVTNTIFISIIALILTFASITSIIALIWGTFVISHLISLIGWIISIIYFVLLILSFKRNNLTNKYFTWAFILNLIGIIFVILFFIGGTVYLATLPGSSLSQITENISKLNSVSSILNYFVSIIYLVSFIIFLIGYFKTKK